MQVKELKHEGLSHELEVTVTAKDIEKHVDARLMEYSKTMKLPGFRPGKVPMAILKQRYGKAVLGEVLEVAVNDSTAKVLKDKNLRPALQPKIEVTQFDEGKDLTYKMEVEVIPEFKVMDLKSLKLEKPVAKVDAKQVDEALERLAKQRRESAPITTDRGAKKGDIVMINFAGRTKKDNKAHAGMQSDNHALELGSNMFIAGFEDQIVGKKKGDKVEVNVTFPTPYHSEELAGAEAIFDVEVKEIREPKAIEIDDEFAKKFGMESAKALREAVEKQIKSEYDQFSRLKLKRVLLDALDEGHDFDIPGGMKDLEFSNIRQQIAMERQHELKGGQLELSADDEEELHAIAERRVRLGLILAEVGRSNNVQVSDQELQRAVITEAQRYPGQEAHVFEYYRKNRQALEALRAPVFEDKVVDFISGLAGVTEKEVSIEDLTKEDEESYVGKKKEGKSSSKKSTKAAKEDAAEGDSEEKKPVKKTAAKKK